MRKFFVPVALAATAVLTAGLLANAAEGDKVTGGGQILADNQTTGAGSTIAFVAMDKGGAKGQVQYVKRDGGTGQGQEVMHGEVLCVTVTENTARLAGEWRDGGDFEIFVEDNGEGADSTDMIFVDNEPVEPNCSEDDGEEDNEPVALARGNVQVH